METNFTCHAWRMIRYAGIIAVLAVTIGGAAHAQFQLALGGLGHEAAKGGVIQIAGGDFIAVGYTTSVGPDQDVYVVRTDGCGFVVWQRVYDLGGADEARKVRELPSGDLVIVGSTENADNCCIHDDAFILSIDPNGTVLWAKTYGGTGRDDANNVILTANSFGNPLLNVVGRSNSFGEGDYDGWIFQTDDLGNLQWGRVYGTAEIDEFNALEINCQGDIVAAGSSRGVTGNGDENILIVWASVANGALVQAMHYGRGGDEAARTILGSGHSFYVAGYTTTMGGGAEGYIMRVNCATGAVLADRTYGRGQTPISDDQFTEMQFLPTGNLILTGFLDDATGGFGVYDMWLTELDAALGHVFSRVYGGSNYDQGWSVAVVDPFSSPYRIIQAGSTYSFNFGRVDFYEVLSTATGDAQCESRTPQLVRNTPAFTANSVRMPDSYVRIECNVTAVADTADLDDSLCTPCDSRRQRRLNGTLGEAAPFRQETDMLVNNVAVRITRQEPAADAYKP